MSARKDSRAATLIESGLRSFQQGQVEQARQCCERALELVPRNPDAMHLLGVIALQRADHEAAVEMLRRAVAIRPDDPAYRCNLGYGYVGLKRMPEALAEFERAARVDGNDPELQLAIGNCLALMGRPAEAEAPLRRLLARHPGHALAWFNLANAVKDQNRYAEAIDLYRRATQLAPRSAEAHCNLGIALHKLGRYEEAREAYRASLALKPDFEEALIALAVTLNCLRQHAEAEALSRGVLARNPAQGHALPPLARALTFQHRWKEAVACYRQIAREFPAHSDAHGDLGNALARTGRMAEAMEAFERAETLGDVSIHTRYAKAVALLAAGRLAEGAAEFAERHEKAAFIEAHPDRPLAGALPDDLSGKTVALHGEQGIGDEIFFLRFAPLLRARGCRIVYHAHPGLVPVLARCETLDEVRPNAAPFAAADHVLFVGDALTHFLGTSPRSPFESRGGTQHTRLPRLSRVYWPEVPPPLALAPLPERRAAAARRLEQLGPPPYIGLTWRAGTGPQEQRGHVWSLFKEAPLERLGAAVRGTNGTLLSLQRKPLPHETAQLSAAAGKSVHDLSAANDDLEEMLALLSLIDEYVGVSNTNMHLRAGAGRTARVLAPWPEEWRWLTSGNTSPWFPGFTVYRQAPGGDWSGAFDRLAGDLGSALRGYRGT